MTCVAAVGDIHVGTDSVGRVAQGLRHVHERADVLLLAGDLTRCGDPSEAELVDCEAPEGHEVVNELAVVECREGGTVEELA